MHARPQARHVGLGHLRLHGHRGEIGDANDDSRSRAGGGSGLGLAIARAIVEGHGGTLTATASPLGGVAIRLVFPRVTGASRD